MDDRHKYRESEWYDRVFQACGNIAHRQKENYCINCKMYCLLIQTALDDHTARLALAAKKAVVDGLREVERA